MDRENAGQRQKAPRTRRTRRTDGSGRSDRELGPSIDALVRIELNTAFHVLRAKDGASSVNPLTSYLQTSNF
jgi:hypothetical protein